MLRPQLPSEPFELSQMERLSSLWLRLEEHLHARLDAARKRNDQILPEADTAAVRGEIKCLKALISLGDERPVID